MSTKPKRYLASEAESNWRRYWEELKAYQFTGQSRGPVYSIDTPPPTVSGDLHMGHCYSYSQTDFYARFWRMNGAHVFYPMGWDDNGLPTERLVEKNLGITPEKVGAEAFLRNIMQISSKLEKDYEQVWRLLGLSVDWRYTYSTNSLLSRRAAQYSFLDLYQKGRVYHSSSPTIWCPFCKTAIAHAEVAEMSRQTEFFTLAFHLEDGQIIPIATTRPELLAGCVAVFINPLDGRYAHLAGRKAVTPIFQREVSILSDSRADPEKGTGVVMCCTFGDATDVKWWKAYALPLVNLFDQNSRLNQESGPLAGLGIKDARQRIVDELSSQGLILNRETAAQTVSVHERCDTPIEYMITRQWFVGVLDRKESFLEAGRKIHWHPPHMLSRFEDWVKNLEWDWCISRQRYHGVPFPLWYCLKCGEVLLAGPSLLPFDPRVQLPDKPCACGSREFTPETSVMDTWMTSSLSPQIAGHWLDQPELFGRVFPMSVRPQAHDIIRTWTFYTLVKSLYHFGEIPWSHIAISGHGLSPEGHKVSKSKGANGLAPSKMMEKYSADAVRYWAACTKLGEDSVISEDRIAAGQRLINKLWNASNFVYLFLNAYSLPESRPSLLPADRWVLSRLQVLVDQATRAFREYDHSAAKIETETFFWNTIADNYLEMAKNRLYDLPEGAPGKESAKYTLSRTILTLLKILAPLMPYVTEELYQFVFRRQETAASIHLADWPEMDETLIDSHAEAVGKALVEIATAARRYKSEHRLAMGSPLERIRVTSTETGLLADLGASAMDVQSVTRAKTVEFVEEATWPDSAEREPPLVRIAVEGMKI